MPPSVAPSHTSEAPRAHVGRHRAARASRGYGRRAAVAVVAAGAPLLPGVLLATPASAETDWDALAECESSGNWGINTGNGFGGGLQFTDSTWKSFGGSGQPEDADRGEQIAVAERVKSEQGMNAWPTCSKKTGNTSKSPNGSVSTVSKSKSGSSKSASKAQSSAKSKSGSSTKSGAPSSGAAPGAGSYTVKAGDTLSSIATSHGKSGWRALQAGNPNVIDDPNMIFPGQTIDL